MGGALTIVFSKAAKFSLFKPAEEMVYLVLDDGARWVAFGCWWG
jgi:AAA family ATP:ADP antiporter